MNQTEFLSVRAQFCLDPDTDREALEKVSLLSLWLDEGLRGELLITGDKVRLVRYLDKWTEKQGFYTIAGYWLIKVVSFDVMVYVEEKHCCIWCLQYDLVYNMDPWMWL